MAPAARFRLRPTTQGDAQEIARILRTTREHSLPYLPDFHTPAEDLEFVEKTVLAEDTVFVAEADGMMLGFCACKRGWIDHLYVLPEHHGQGIGTALLDQAKSGNGRLELWTFQKNVRAIKFYRDNGFVLAETTDGTGNEEEEPDARFVWVRENDENFPNRTPI